MFLTRYSRYVLKSKPFLPKSFVKTSALLKEISNEPLQKPNAASDGNFANKADEQVSAQEDSSQNVSNASDERAKAAPAEEKAAADAAEQVDASSVTTSPFSLVQRKEVGDILYNADPFEEVPGPKLLKKLTNVWKYLPEIGCQAMVSAMLSYFNMSQKLTVATKLGRISSRPFDRLFRKYGPIVKLQGPLGAEVVLICKPEHVAKVYEQEGKHPVRCTLDSVEKSRSQSRRNCGGPFNLSGIEWEEMRKALQEPMKRSGEKYFDVIDEAASTFVRKIQIIRNRQNEVPEDFMTEVTKWSMECLCFITLGKSLGFHSAENIGANSDPVRLLQALMEATQNMCQCESGFQLWRIMKTRSLTGLTQACETIDSFISKHIRLAQVNLTKNKDEILNKEKTESNLPFIENLLLNECMAPDEVLTCIVDLLLLGVNTTRSALSFMMYHLAQSQRTQRVLFKEVKELLPEKDSKCHYQQLSSMTYLDACMKESLRLKMPMPTLTRILPQDIVLSNFRIPRGTYMVMDVQAACLRETNFEKCDKFIPERWLDPSNIQYFSFIPFGYGSRSCVAKHLAEIQLKACIARVVRNYQIEYNYGEIQGTPTVISFPNMPLKLTFTEREK